MVANGACPIEYSQVVYFYLNALASQLIKHK